MANRLAALKFGARVRFRDRWEGTVAAIEVDESWEVINLIVGRGVLRWKSTVKLPFSNVLDWSDNYIAFDCTSRAAFAREIPPIAAAARPISAQTPVELPQATLAGIFVSGNFADALLINQGSGVKRQLKVAVQTAVFEGKTLHVLGQSESLPSYHSDDEIRGAVRLALARDGHLLGDDRQALRIEVSSGEVRLSGNVRTKAAKEVAALVSSGVQGVATVENEIVDDTDIEMAIGQMLNRSGLQPSARVFARSSLGVVTLYGYPASDRTAFEVIRAVSKISGIQRLISRLETVAAATP